MSRYPATLSSRRPQSLFKTNKLPVTPTISVRGYMRVSMEPLLIDSWWSSITSFPSNSDYVLDFCMYLQWRKSGKPTTCWFFLVRLDTGYWYRAFAPIVMCIICRCRIDICSWNERVSQVTSGVSRLQYRCWASYARKVRNRLYTWRLINGDYWSWCTFLFKLMARIITNTNRQQTTRRRQRRFANDLIVSEYRWTIGIVYFRISKHLDENRL